MLTPAAYVTDVRALTPNGAYNFGDTVQIDVTFSSPVTVSGTPMLLLALDVGTAAATYTSGSESETLTFTYTVGVADNTLDLEYTSTTALVLGAAQIYDVYNEMEADLTLPTPGTATSLGGTSNIVIDNLAPNAPMGLMLNFMSDTGTFGDGITNLSQIYIDGFASDAQKITFYDTDGTTVIGSGNPGGSVFTIQTSALAEGPHIIRATATDAAGNESVLSESLLVTIDRTPPTATIIGIGASNLKAGQTVTVVFTFSENIMTVPPFIPSVSGGTLGPISVFGPNAMAEFTPTPFVNAGFGQIIIQSNTISDVAGNQNQTMFAWVNPVTYDTLPPAPPSAPDLQALSDDGLSDSDNITTKTTPTFTGTAEPLSTVYLYDSSSTTLIGTAPADASGYWTITSSTLNVGSHAIYATAQDAVGNVSDPGAPLLMEIQQYIPTLSITSDKSSLKAGETATITFTFSDDPGDSFAWNGSDGDIIALGGSLSAITGTGLVRTAIFTPAPNTNFGNLTIYVDQGAYFDASSNPGQEAVFTALTYDTLVPNAPSVPSLGSGTDTGTSDSDNITALTVLVFQGSAEAGTTVKLYDTDGTTLLGTDIASIGIWSITTSVLSPGLHTITARATDLAGNVSDASTAVAVLIDTTAPSVVVTADVSTLKIGETATVTFSFSEDPGDSFVWNGISGGLIVTGGTLSPISGTGLTRSAIFTPAAGVNGGSGGVTVQVGSYTDTAGNPGTGDAVGLIYDTEAPEPSYPELYIFSNTGSTADTITAQKLVLLVGSAETGATVTLYDTDGTTVLGSGPVAGLTWSIPTPVLSEGTHWITSKVTDGAGNTSISSDPLILVIDYTSPTVVITSDVETLNVGQTATITFTFSEDPGESFTWNGSSGSVVVTGGILGPITGTGLTRTATFTPTSGPISISVPEESYSDVAGNYGMAGSSPSILADLLPPDPPSTPDLADDSDSGVSHTDNLTNITIPRFTGVAEAGATVTLYDTDRSTVLGTAVAINGVWSITASYLSPGEHSIRAKAQDAAGNISEFSDAVVVTVDVIMPVYIGFANVQSLKAGETATITFSFSEDPGDTFTWDGASGDLLVTGGTLSALTGTGLVRTAIFTPTANTNGGVGLINLIPGTFTDAAGNIGMIGIPVSVSYDTLIPSPPSLLGLSVLTDTGVSSSDGITYIASPTVIGLAEEGALITLYDTDGTTVLGTGTAAGGNWSIVTSHLAAGAHALTARATDSAGNVSELSNSFVVVVDFTMPSVALSSDKLFLKNGETAIITFTFSEDPGTTFNWDGMTGDIVVNGGTLGQIVGTGTVRTAVFTPLSGIETGVAILMVLPGVYTDAAGNFGLASPPLILAFDTAAPVVPTAPALFGGDELADPSDTGFSATDRITRVIAPTFVGAAESGSRVKLYDTDGTTVIGEGLAVNGQYRITVSPLTPGEHTVKATATDINNNVSGLSEGVTVTIDTTAPTATIEVEDTDLIDGDSTLVTITFSEPVTGFANGDLTITHGTLTAVKSTDGGRTWTATFTPRDGVYSPQTAIVLNNAGVKDVAGNPGVGTTASNFFAIDTNDSPTGILLSAANVAEGAANQTVVGTLTAVDPDLNDTFTFTLTNDADGRFTIANGNQLVVANGSLIDYETTTTHTVTVQVQDVAGNQFSKDFVITVLPVNDNDPVFSRVTFCVAENIANVGTLTVTDADLPAGITTFSLDDTGDSGLFAITPEGVLTFKVAPDFEQPGDFGRNNVYEVDVIADDGFGHRYTQRITVQVTPVNDNSPFFISASALEIFENSTAVGTVVATDADLPAQTVTYSITGGADAARFTISSDGTLSFITAPDFELPTDLNGDNVYEVEVKADDGRDGTTVQIIRVTVKGIDDNQPYFTSLQTFTVAENSTLVGNVVAADADLPAQSLTYCITGGADAALFTITADGQLAFINAPDFENPADELSSNVYHLTVTVHDGHSSTAQQITVTVTPQNEFAPQFTNATPTFTIAENSGFGTVVGTVSATDADDSVSTVTYSIISGNTGGAFGINPITGQITVEGSRTLDFETHPTFTLTVRASDNDGTPLTTDIVVVINLVNLPETPQIDLPLPTGTYHLGSRTGFVSPQFTFSTPEQLNPSYNGAKLIATITSGKQARDLLRLEGVSGRQAVNVTVRGRNVYYGALKIGTINSGGGVDPQSLSITFNEKASTAAVQAVLRRVAFFTRTNPGTNRTVELQLTGVSGVDSNIAIRVLSVVE